MGIWIDCDMGFDDIAAIMVATSHGLQIDGLSLVFGNAPLAQVRRNAASAKMAFGWDFPIHTGRENPVLGKLETAQTILGDTGIPTVGAGLPDAADLPHGDAFQALCDWLENGGENKHILALGPLTNIAALCLARPDLVARITDLIWMGGGVTAGNHTASAEFNAFADPEALAIVIAHGLPLRMVDLDLCRKVTAGLSDVAPIRAAGGKNAELIADMLEGFINIATSRGRDAMALYDPCAALALVAPDCIGWKTARIDVELHGTLTRGRTVVETRAAHASTFNAQFAENVDAISAKSIILDALRQEASR
ncbi:nucleoside hydrolase [Agrobacterium rosae]|uniref:Nucleoside hydrolase n=1 Tax=Agrobacterium rosae TaxID=1972867 RepID=A0AAW9FC18_9HYPH|nr:nucleoside hydrolase [Agrobacterium rosae]MDX8302022.1 nucleoside hydrolase [Agrobacterium rosae]POO51048.1 nucleoside hydrolase [Agrobacterium rosae]